MSISKLTRNLVLLFGIGLASCTSDHRDIQYQDFRGMLNGKFVEFTEGDKNMSKGPASYYGNLNYLTIWKPDGIRVQISDNDGSNDFQVDEVWVIQDAVKSIIYSPEDSNWETVRTEAQRQFDMYLKLIIEQKNKKKQEGFEKIKERELFRE